MKTTVIGGAAALAMIAIVPAFAQQKPSPAPQVQDRLGEPGHHGLGRNQVHTREEVQRKVAEHFARLDTNRDGFLTRQEADAGRAAMADRIRTRVAERRADPTRGQAAFDRVDTNRDGSISRQEFDAHHAQRGHAMAARAHGMAARAHAKAARGAHGAGARLHGRMFEVADANRDGRVSLAEAQAAALRHFDMADADRNGVVTREERIQRRQQMRQERSRG